MKYLHKKKFLIMTMAEKIRGFLRTVSGIPPLTLKGCVDKDSIINYTIRGNILQSSTPDHNSPAEMKVVGDFDESTGKYKVPITIDGEHTVNIYLDNPLRSIGKWRDYIDFEKKQLVRYIYSEKITKVREMSSMTGTYKVFLSNISKNPDSSTHGTYIGPAISNFFSTAVKDGYDYYQSLTSMGGVIGSYRTGAGASTVAYTFSDSRIKSVSAATAAIGNGFEVCYVLANPTAEHIDLPEVVAKTGTVICSVDTKTPPSNMKVSYYSYYKE